MNFIIWTAVWWGMILLEKTLCYGYPYKQKELMENSKDDLGFFEFILIAMWIGLYIIFIK